MSEITPATWTSLVSRMGLVAPLPPIAHPCVPVAGSPLDGVGPAGNGFSATPSLSRGGCGLRVIAELDVDTAPGLEAAAARVFGSGNAGGLRSRRGWFLLDLTDMTFCDCSGLHALGRIHADSEAHHQRLRVAVPTASGPRRVLRLAAEWGWLAPHFGAYQDMPGRDSSGETRVSPQRCE